MQPYVFPYLGYFQLINAVDTFVFYDDVNFIKRGWINRNKILCNNKDLLFTIPLAKASQNKIIKDVEILIDEYWISNFLKTLDQNYKKAPYFKETFQLVSSVFKLEYNSISELAIASIILISRYLEININFEVSSRKYFSTQGQEKSERLINIAKESGCENYINPIGGLELYNKTAFKKKGINLHFIKNELKPYKQFNNEFVNGLSIIDVLMFNSKIEIKELINNYKLI